MACGALTQANNAVHEGIDTCLLDLLEAITALDMGAVPALWRALVERLEGHATWEEANTFPRYAALPDHPRGGGPALFEADHASLRKVTGAAAEAIEIIAAARTNQRRVMITQLGSILRLRSVLEHHSLREERFLYPRLDEVLPKAEGRALADALRAAHPCGRSPA